MNNKHQTQRFYKTKFTIIYFVFRVADNPGNNMSAANLSLLFGPCIVFDVISYLPNEDPMMSFDIPNLCIEFMINGYDEIFENKSLYKQQLSQESDDESEYGTQV